MVFDDHHLIPTSRGGKNGTNVVKKPEHLHRGWHQIFGNCCSWEAIELVELLKKVFGNKTPEEIIEEIRKRWTYPGNGGAKK